MICGYKLLSKRRERRMKLIVVFVMSSSQFSCEWSFFSYNLMTPIGVKEILSWLLGTFFFNNILFRMPMPMPREEMSTTLSLLFPFVPSPLLLFWILSVAFNLYYYSLFCHFNNEQRGRVAVKRGNSWFEIAI